MVEIPTEIFTSCNEKMDYLEFDMGNKTKHFTKICFTFSRSENTHERVKKYKKRAGIDDKTNNQEWNLFLSKQ